MTNIFHLSLPVSNFEDTRFFYCDLLTGIQEKTTPDWFNVNLNGHQVTFHFLPEEVISSKQTGTPAERVKMVFTDPSGYLIEYKAYKYDAARF